VKLTVVGCSPAYPNPGGAHSGYLLESSKTAGNGLLLDCGPGVLGRLRERDTWPKVSAIVLSHLHLDHCGDLIPWLWGSQSLAADGAQPARPQLWLPPGGRERLNRFEDLFASTGLFETVFVIEEYEPGKPFSAAGYSIVAARVPHYGIEACALRVTADDAIVAYSGDSAPCDALVEIARGADLFVCEATLRASELVGRRGHLSLDDAEAAFEASKARQLLIVHRPFDLPPPQLDRLARDGLVLEL
jgi:ribonuclease BN (tRNA processing enzyme)